jgi:hypothetical protein
VRLEGLGQLKNSVNSSGIEPAGSVVPQPTTLPRASTFTMKLKEDYIRGKVDTIQFRIYLPAYVKN